MIDPHSITTAEQLSRILTELGFVTGHALKIDSNPVTCLVGAQPNHHDNHVRVAVTSDGLNLEVYDDFNSTFRLWELIQHPIAEEQLRDKIRTAASIQSIGQLLYTDAPIAGDGGSNAKYRGDE